MPYIPGTRGFPPTVPLHESVNAILFKLKTGVQWAHLPVSSLFDRTALRWQSVYRHYRKWCRNGTLKHCWTKLLERHRASFDLSSVDLDGSHTPAIRDGEGVAYPGRKKRKTTNALYFTDRQGLPLARSEPVAGNLSDIYEIEVICGESRISEILNRRRILNADPIGKIERLLQIYASVLVNNYQLAVK